MERILEILLSIKPDGGFKESKNFIDDGLLDSLDIFDLIEKLEHLYNIQFQGKDIVPENFDSCESIYKLVKLYRGE